MPAIAGGWSARIGRNGKVIVRRGLAAVMVLALIAGGVALAARAQALSERLLADSDTLAAQSQATGGTDPAQSRLEAVAAWNLVHTSAAQYAMLKAALLPATVFLGNDNPGIKQVAFSRDSRLLAVGTQVGGIEVWDTATHKLGATLPADPGGFVSAVAFIIQRVAFSPNGKLLAANTGTAGVQVWQVAAPHHLYITLGAVRPTSTSAVAFSPDSKLLAVGTDGGGVQVWQVTSPYHLDTTLGSETGSSTESVAFSPDGSHLAEGTSGGVQIWNLTSSGPSTPISSAASAISVAFGLGGTVLAVGTGSEIQLWDTATNQQIGALPATYTDAGLTIGPPMAFSA